MRKKILSIIITLIMIITIVSCVEVKETKIYESPSEYETKIIETSANLENTTVALAYDDEIVASAVVIDVKNTLGNREVTAITTAELVVRFGEELKVFANRTNRSTNITKVAYNEDYDFAIIKFETTSFLKAVKLTETINYNVGQTIITIGTTATLDRFNAIKVGMINNDNLEYKELGKKAFMHDASNNPGEKGAGVFDINGNLLGLNGLNYISTETNNENEFVLGMTLAIRTKDFIGAINKIDQIDFTTKHIPEELFINNELTLVEYESNYDYEKQLITLNKQLKETTVTITNGDELASGLIYSKESDTENYWIITKNFDDFSNLTITNNGVIPLEVIQSISLENYYLSIHKVRSQVPLVTYTSKAIDEGIGTELVKGQTLVTIGNPLKQQYYHNFNIATLSKTTYLEEQLFMHDGNLNFGQAGSPIFNLSGELVGFNVYKVDSITTQTGNIAAEGLANAVNINYVAQIINNYTYNNNFNVEVLTQIDSYQSNIEYEQLIIDIVKKQDKTTVTVLADSGGGSGHGSGVIFKKERLNNKFLYYVLTNEHVIEGNESMEITIQFADDRESILAKDFANIKTYDLGIVRFESEENYEIAEISAVINNSGINPVKGQTLIAIGTPYNNDRTGYVTTGNITIPTTSYGVILKLAVNHNTPLNPGNSGGPLFNLAGELVGLNVSKMTAFNTYAGNIPAEGVGTTLNINVLSPIINSFKETDYKVVSKRARMGITVSDFEVFDGDKDLLPISPDGKAGVVVVDVNETSDAIGRVFSYDLITHVNGERVEFVNELALLIAGKLLGETVELTVLRLENNAPVEHKFIIEFK